MAVDNMQAENLLNYKKLNGEGQVRGGTRADPYRSVVIPSCLSGFDCSDALEPYESIQVALQPVWGEDTEFVEEWFQRGEELKDDWIDWIDWIDLYTPKVDRSDFLVHWLRCLFDPDLPRPGLNRD